MGPWSFVVGRVSFVCCPWSLVFGRLSFVLWSFGLCSLVLGLWSFALGFYSLVFGRWSLLLGRWCLVVGLWSFVFGLCTQIGHAKQLQLPVLFAESVGIGWKSFKVLHCGWNAYGFCIFCFRPLYNHGPFRYRIAHPKMLLLNKNLLLDGLGPRQK